MMFRLKYSICTLIFLIILLTLSNSLAQAPSELSEASKRLSESPQWQAFTEKYGSHLKVRWNERTGAPRRIFGPIRDEDIIGDSSSPQTIARNFIAANDYVLKADSTDLALAGSYQRKGASFVTYQQFHSGVPVYGGKIGMVVADEGDILALGSGLYPNIQVSTTPTVSPGEAIRIAQGVSGISNLKWEPQIALIILPEEFGEEVQYALAWHFTLIERDGSKGRVFLVDAHRGSLLRQGDAFLRATISGTVTGYIVPEYENTVLEETQWEKPSAKEFNGISGKWHWENPDHLTDGHREAPRPFAHQYVDL